jgi:hypothetical protein
MSKQDPIAAAEQAKRQAEQHVADAEKVVAEIGEKRQALGEAGLELVEARKRAAFAAHCAGAVDRLDEASDAVLRHASTLRDLDDALGIAKEKAVEARAALKRAGDILRAHQTNAAKQSLVANCNKAGAAGEALGEALGAVFVDQQRLHVLGCLFPSQAQLLTFVFRGVITLLRRTPVGSRFETLAPDQRVRFSDLGEAWEVTIQRHIDLLLGEGEQHTDDQPEPEVAA